MSDARFADGLRYRVEIPSCEGPAVMRAVLEEAAARDVAVRRVSQGSGVMMLTDDEIAEMAQLGAEHGVEVSLFLGPRGAWDAVASGAYDADIRAAVHRDIRWRSSFHRSNNDASPSSIRWTAPSLMPTRSAISCSTIS